MFWNKNAPIITLLLSLLLCFSFSFVQARELLPTPPGGGVGNTILAGDEDFSGKVNSPTDWYQIREEKIRKDINRFSPIDKSEGDSSIGGYDVGTAHDAENFHSDLAVAENGDIYHAYEVYSSAYGFYISFRRSTDGGTTWEHWGQLFNVSPSETYRAPSIVVAEGTENRLYVAYARESSTSDRSIRMSWADLTDNVGLFNNEVTVMEQSGTHFDYPDLATDSVSFSSYYLYVVAQAIQSGSGEDIWYARSTNRAASFEDAYPLGTLSGTDRGYHSPKVSWGYGGVVHTSWHFSVDDINDDDAVRYRRSGSDGGGGIGNWDGTIAMTSRYNAMEERNTRIAASTNSDEVMLVFSRVEWVNNSYYATRGIGSMLSHDAGLTWGDIELPDSSITQARELLYQSQSEEFILGGNYYSKASIQRTSRHEPVDWSFPKIFGDASYVTGYLYNYGFALDESHNQQVCTIWPKSSPSMNPDYFYFDAEWKGDPGNPNLMPGFPVEFEGSARSAPALADLDNDGDLEILFINYSHSVYAYHHDGTLVSGWPVIVPETPSKSPVAIGDLGGYGQMTVVVGTREGQVYAYDPDGNLLSGFPFQMPSSDPVFVSIGSLGSSSARTIVCGGGGSIRYLDYQGQNPSGAVGWYLYDQTITHAAAIGDIDGDGISEIAMPGTDKIFVVEMESTIPKWYLLMDADISDSPTMADFDLDGDVEVVIPCANGTLQVKNDDGANLSGFPVSTGSGLPLSSAAIAQVRSQTPPDIVFSDEISKVYAYYHDGDLFGGFPVTSYNEYSTPKMPVLDNINDYFGTEIVHGSSGKSIWAWSNFGLLKPGWPRELDHWLSVSPATGDLDGNGTVEVVFLAQNQLYVIDTQGFVADIYRRWPMVGHNSQRTGCLNCPEDMVSAVEPEDNTEPLVTRIKFAAPSPNPTSGPTLFSFELPVRSAIRLEVFDIRGHMVRSVVKEELPPGPHAINWDGRDAGGKSLASGVYFARLKVRGPGLDQQLNRKLNLLR